MKMPTWFFLLFIIASSQRCAALTAGTNPASNFNVNLRSSSSCQLTVVGTFDGLDAVQSASVHCSEADNLSLEVDPIIEPFIGSFTGVNVSVADVQATEVMSALFSFTGDHVNLVASSFQNLTTSRSTVLLLLTNSMSITNSSFVNNQALLTSGFAMKGQAHISVDTCTFFNNSGQTGAAMSFDGSSSNCTLTQDCMLSIRNSRFVNNSAGLKGEIGAVYLQTNGFEIMLSNSTFLHNSAGDGMYDPLAVRVVGGLALASPSNAALRQSTGSILFMVNTTFDSNFGGAVGGSSLEGLKCAAFSNSTFVGNQGALGALYMLQVSGDSTECVQHAENTPFAAQLTPYFDNLFTNMCNVEIRHSSFVGNFRALYFDSLEQPVLVADSIFEGNHAVVEPGTGGAGGGVYMIGSFFAYITIMNCHFIQNSSPFLGGAIFVLSFSIRHSVTNSILDGNQAAVSGGGVTMVDGSLTVNGSALVNNMAGSQGGGGISCRDCVRLSVANTTLVNNTCLEVGGAVKVSGLPASNVMLHQVIATGNRAMAGGALSVDSIGNFGNTYVIITSSTVSNNTASGALSGSDFSTLGGLGGALRIFAAVLWIDGSELTHNIADSIGGAVFFNHSCALAPLIYYSTRHQFDFRASLQNQTCTLFVLSHTQLASNTAQGAGGAIYTTSPKGFYTVCANDNSTESPGAFNLASLFAYFNQTADSTESLPPVCPEWETAANKAAHYGDTVAYPAAKLVIQCNPYTPNGYQCVKPAGMHDSSGLRIDSFWSTSAVDAALGQPTARLLLDVVMLDMANQPMLMDYPQTRLPLINAVAPAGSPSLLFGQLSAAVNSTSQTASFTTLLVKGRPGMYNITFTAADHKELPIASVLLQVRSCLLGEIKGQEGNVCDECPSGQYSLDQMDEACTTCPSNAVCPNGTASFIPEEGFWHSAANSTLIHRCPNSDACRGKRAKLELCQQAWYHASNNPQAQAGLECQLWDDSTYSNSSYLSLQCSTGYEGPLCTTCSFGHGASGNFKCVLCPHRGLAAFEYLLVLVGTILVNAFLVWRLLDEKCDHWDQTEGSDLVEALLKYVQLASLLGMLDVRWPSPLGGLFKAFAWVTYVNPQTAVLDCILPHSTGSLPLAATRILVQLAVPLIILSSFCTAWVVAFVYLQKFQPSDRRGPAWLTKRLQLTSYSVLGYFYPSLTQGSLSVFACYPIDHPVPPGTLYQTLLKATRPAGYWKSDMRHACFAGWHLALTLALGLPALLLFSAAIPLLIWVMLLLHRHQLGTASCKQQLGYAYKSYKLNRWWEAPMYQLKMLAMLLVVVNGRPLGKYLPSIMLLSLLCFEYLYQQVLQPPRTHELQHWQTATVALLISSMVAGLILQDYEKEASQAGLAAVAIFMGIANCVFVAYLLYAICSKYIGKVQTIVSKVNSRFTLLRQESGALPVLPVVSQ